jgi:hypothetical protein
MTIGEDYLCDKSSVKLRSVPNGYFSKNPVYKLARSRSDEQFPPISNGIYDFIQSGYYVQHIEKGCSMQNVRIIESFSDNDVCEDLYSSLIKSHRQSIRHRIDDLNQLKCNIPLMLRTAQEAISI